MAWILPTDNFFQSLLHIPEYFNAGPVPTSKVSQDKTVSGAHQVFMCTNKSSTDKWGAGLGQ